MAAGLGFKDFTTGEVLTAADVDGYLMQGIWVFASNAARDAAVTAPAKGNFAFTKDTNSLWYYDGAAWVASGATGDIEGVTAGVGISGGGTSGTVTITNSMATAIDAKGDLVAGTGADTFSKLTVGANNTVLTADSTTATGLKWAAPAGGGKVLQVVSAISSTSTSTSSSSFSDITDVTATITPSAATSKILVLVSLDWRKTSGSGSTSADFKLLRGATAIVNSVDYTLTEASEYATSCWSINYYDSPSTTSATTYKMQVASRNATASIQVGFQGANSQQSITLLEIGA